MTGLSELVAPYGVEEFLGAVWGRRMEVFRGAADRFTGLLPWPALNDILRRHRLETPRLRLAQGGDRVDPATYTTDVALRRGGSYQRIQYGDLAAAIRDGATLVIDSIDELYGPIDELATDLEHRLRERVQVNCYASFGAVHGFDTHWDDHDVLAVQIHGRKHWRVFGPTRPHPTRRDVAHPEPPVGDPADDFILTAGDALHVPRGYWHDASAMTEPSVHLTFGFTGANGVDLAAWVADELRRHDLARQDLPRFGAPETQRQRVKELAEALAADLAEPGVLDRFFAARDGQAPPRGGASLPYSVHQGLPGDPGTSVRLVVPRAVLRTRPDVTEIDADGRRYTFAAAATPLLRALLDCAPHTLAELAASAPELDAATVRAFADELIRQGLLATA
jgi:hypothetical protein